MGGGEQPVLEIRRVAHTLDVLGEVPRWHPTDKALWWIDLFKPAVHRFDPAGGQVSSWVPPMKLGSYAFARHGKLLLAGRDGLCLYDPESGRAQTLGHPEAGRPENLLNDGRADRRGRFWVGSMNKMIEKPSGNLLRICTAGDAVDVQVMDSGFWVSNGIAWSPDDRHLYFADSHTKIIWVYDFDLDSGSLGERRIFADTSDMPGVPDGASVDQDGFVWSARFDGAAVIRYDPSGKIERKIDLPVSRPTACTFGGEDLTTLYVTTARFRLPPATLDAQPDSGALLAVEVGIRGQPEPYPTSEPHSTSRKRGRASS
jgi:L-arabinonolactonase